MITEKHATEHITNETGKEAGKITKDTTIGDVVKNFPQVIPTLMSYGVHCVGCHVSEFETIEQGLMGHGYDKEFVDKAIEELNNVSKQAPEKSVKTCGSASEKTVTITDAAAEKVKELMKKEGQEKAALRIEVIPGGCSGMSYDFSFDDKQRADDIVVEKNGLKVFVDEASMEYIGGSVVNYVETLHEAGFKIENPNAKSSCGCGSSFS